MPKASSVSSYPNLGFIIATAKNGMTPAAMPMMIAPLMFTKPAAGVIATSPPTAPDARPSTVGFPECIHSTTIQAMAATAVAVFVLMNAAPARPLAARADPALNPNQPNHSRPAPVMTRVRLLGMIAFSLPLAQDQSADERRDARIDMDHGAAREIKGAQLHQESAAPYPVGHRHIDRPSSKARKTAPRLKTSCARYRRRLPGQR